MIRLIDILISFLGIILFAPFLIMVVIVIRFEIKKPFFLQERVGLKKKPFNLIKFRTMKIDTPSIGTHLTDKSVITKTGNLLRVTKIDELPQLWNVFVGEMSLVGPRPCLYNQKELILERENLGIFNFKPGITGLSQIKKIDMSTPKLLAQKDFEMVNELNLKTYFYCILRTLKFFFTK